MPIDMTYEFLKKIKSEKEIVESKIRDEINKFTKSTDLKVKDIRVNSYDYPKIEIFIENPFNSKD